MTKRFLWLVGFGAALSLGAACSSSSGDDGDGGSGGMSEDGGNGGSSSGGSGGTNSSTGGSSTGGSGGGSSSGGGGGSSSGGGGGSTKPFGDTIAIDNYAKSVGQAQCDQLWKCCETEAKAVDPMMSKCQAKLSSPIIFGLAGLKKAVMGGTVVYDGAKLAGCLNDLAALSCTAKQSDVDAVKGCKYLEGKVANDGACAITPECKEGYCAKTGSEAMGKCAARKAIDAACAAGDECMSGNCKKAAMDDAMGKCAAAVEEVGLCGYLSPG